MWQLGRNMEMLICAQFELQRQLCRRTAKLAPLYQLKVHFQHFPSFHHSLPTVPFIKNLQLALFSFVAIHTQLQAQIKIFHLY